MSKFTDQEYLKEEQYRDSSNLDARAELHRRFSTNSYGWFPWIFDTLEKLPEKAHVLELGCGPAYMWKECPDRIPNGWTIIMSDLSEGMLKTAWRNMAVTGRAFKYEQIDAQSIPYDDETFDIVIANHMLFHLENRPKGLSEIQRVLKKDGNLIATTVGNKHLVEITNWLQFSNPDTDFPVFGAPFTLDYGYDQLKPYFSKVETKRYDDNLRVTEIEPLMAHIRSTQRADELTELDVKAIQQQLENILKTEGEIFISKDSGLFLAVK